MADIFISYSRKDTVRGTQLAEMFTSAGLSVWMDLSGIEAATSWSEEIVSAIDACRVFVILLSESSVASHNVVKEVSLASEKRKKILPIDLEPVSLPKSLQYPLAGLQRAPMTNIDSIISALTKLGLDIIGVPTMKRVKEAQGKKSLMTLPFEDHSPTGDNGWFADGIVSELIGALSGVKALRVADPTATKEFKNYKGQLTNYANEMGIRYFVMGSVRKFGDQIKIAVQLLDIETGDYMWQDTMKGVMQDIFDIQEEVATKVVEGLKVHLADEERKKFAERGTENAEAYELFMKASEYTDKSTKEGLTHGMSVVREAIKLDPQYAAAYRFLAHAQLMYYRIYDRDPRLLEEAERLIDRSLELRPTFWRAYEDRSLIYMYQGKMQEAEEAALKFIEHAPDEYSGHFALGFFYMETGQPARAIRPFEAALRLKPDHIRTLFNICLVCSNANEPELLVQWANEAVPYYARHVRMHPDDDGCRIYLGGLLNWAGRNAEATEAISSLASKSDIDPFTQYNLACFQAELSNHAESLVTLRRSVERGFSAHKLVEGWSTNSWVVANPAYVSTLDEIIALSKSRIAATG